MSDFIPLLGGLVSSLFAPKPKVDPVSQELAAWMKQYGPQALSTLQGEALAGGLTPQTQALQRQVGAAGQTALQQGTAQTLAGLGNAGFDMRGNMLPSWLAALGTGINNNVMSEQATLGQQDQARKDALLQQLLGAVTGQAGVAAGGYQRAYDVQAQQQQGLSSALGNLAYAWANRAPQTRNTGNFQYGVTPGGWQNGAATANPDPYFTGGYNPQPSQPYNPGSSLGQSYNMASAPNLGAYNP